MIVGTCIDERKSEFVRTGALYDFKKLLACLRMIRFGFFSFFRCITGFRSILDSDRSGHASFPPFSVS